MTTLPAATEARTIKVKVKMIDATDARPIRVKVKMIEMPSRPGRMIARMVDPTEVAPAICGGDE